MSLQLPLNSDAPHYRVGTTLQGIQYLLDVRWNSREEAWYMTISSVEDIVLIAGIKLVLGVFLTRLSHDERLPDGEFMVSDLSDTSTEATLTDLGERVAVYFIPTEELESGDII